MARPRRATTPRGLGPCREWLPSALDSGRCPSGHTHHLGQMHTLPLPWASPGASDSLLDAHPDSGQAGVPPPAQGHMPKNTIGPSQVCFTAAESTVSPRLAPTRSHREFATGRRGQGGPHTRLSGEGHKSPETMDESGCHRPGSWPFPLLPSRSRLRLKGGILLEDSVWLTVPHGASKVATAQG